MLVLIRFINYIIFYVIFMYLTINFIIIGNNDDYTAEVTFIIIIIILAA